MTVNGINYTFINIVEIFKIINTMTGYPLYKIQTSINMYRDRMDDMLSLGRIGLSIYNSTVLLSMETGQPSTIKYMPMCNYN